MNPQSTAASLPPVQVLPMTTGEIHIQKKLTILVIYKRNGVTYNLYIITTGGIHNNPYSNFKLSSNVISSLPLSVILNGLTDDDDDDDG